MKYALLKIAGVWVAAFLLSSPVSAQVKLPRIVRDSMVLQRDAAIPIWGWASKGERIKVTFNGKSYNAQAGADGKWKLQLAATPAGGPYTMQITGKNRIILKDILVGDVWLCSGQSNMEHQMRLHNTVYARDILGANYPGIRQFKVPNVTSLTGPQDDLPDGNWKWANPENVDNFSAVAYFFARAMYEKYQVPVGIINASWGGSPIEAWMSEESLKPFPGISAILQKNKDTAQVFEYNRNASGIAAIPPAGEDKGWIQKWYDPAYVPKGWQPFAVPGYWEDQGIHDLDGIVWFRREIEVPVEMTDKPARLFMGRIVDADEVYINGQKVGGFGYMYPQRRYQVREGLLKPGKNILMVRVTNNAGKGGFVPDKPYQLITDNDTLDLTGYWRYKVGQVFAARRKPAGTITVQYQPAALFNAMLAPVQHYAVRGFLWYQGESNTANPEAYAQLQPAMIAEWRRLWRSAQLPFLFAQLPGFMDYNYLPAESGWAAFREAQAKTLNIPHTGMAVTIDLGEWNDIHPDRKKEVGERLALQAQRISYGESLVYTGPQYRSAVIAGSKIVIEFDHTGSGLTASDGEELQEFAVAGADKKFVWGKAVIENNKIVVSSDNVPDPRYVRYAWADNPVNPNLVNKEGLPAAPFRTDH